MRQLFKKTLWLVMHFYNFILVCFVFFNKENKQCSQCFSGGLTYECQISVTAAFLRQKKIDFTLFSVTDHGSLKVPNSKVQN